MKLNPQQVITLASIVEREAKMPSERATIASVYLNRLAKDMPLQADPTVQYAVATRDGQAAARYDYWRNLSPDDLSIASAYNTYAHPGLPPGPICNPGEASIRAVLQPAQTDYLYFVADTDGSGTHLFAKTLDEHNANVARLRTIDRPGHRRHRVEDVHLRGPGRVLALGRKSADFRLPNKLDR